MNTNAPGQLLGYSIQYPRALCHLLKADPGSSVCIEVLGDVATIFSTGEVVAEEDKSSINGNPLTDRSSDLWKTFSNWVDDVNHKKLNISSTKFVLFRNKSGRSAIVDSFDEAANSKESSEALEKAKLILSDLNADHEAWKYYDNAVLKNPKVLIAIIERFHLETGDGAGYEEVALEVKKKLVPSSQVNFVLQNLNGWLVKQVSERISAKDAAVITWEEFHKQFLVLFDRARRLELIDFALNTPPSSKDIQSQVNCRPIYLRQLESINSHDDEIMEAVTDYLRARINRDKWIENEIMDESVASDFEIRLESFWKNTRKLVEITNKNYSNEERGNILLAQCKSHVADIRGANPPHSTIAGTYHALADELTLGWHPNWAELSTEWS